MRKLIFILFVTGSIAFGQARAKNVILFLGDGTGTSTINAASIYGHSKPGALYVQNMPFIGLSDTSSASSWVCDSAAGMTAIVTGQKTHNGVISQSSTARRGEHDGEPLKTILEYAEEHGLSTGVVSNSEMADATPAACYAHSNDRSKFGEIFAQVLKPRFGDGVDVILGPGRTGILNATSALGLDLAAELPRKGFVFLNSPKDLDRLDPDARRVVALWDSGTFDLSAVVDKAIQILSRNPKGFFLMVESDNHSTNVKSNLERLVAFDGIIRRTGEKWKNNTLVLFTADHSYDLRLPRGKQGEDIVPLVKVEDSHTAEEVLVSAEGPGADRLHGFLPNTQIFHIMMAAYGWK